MVSQEKLDELPNDGGIPKKKKKEICILCGPTYNLRSRFPKCEMVREKWIQFCQATSSNRYVLNPETSRLCHAHFQKNCFCRSKDGSIHGLMRNAIPTIHTPYENGRSEDSTGDSALDFTIRIQNSFRSIMPKTREIIQHDKMHKSHDSSADAKMRINNSQPEDSIPELKQHDKNEIQSEESLHDVDSIVNLSTSLDTHHKDSITSSTPSTPHRVNSTSSLSPPIGLQCMESTPSKSHQHHRSIPRAHAIRYIRDIRVTDLESPRRRHNCISVMHYESQVTRNKIKNLQKENTRLKKKVQDLKEALKKLQKEKLVSSGRADK